jgi:DNA replication protein DnaC
MIRGVIKVRIADLLWNKTFSSLNATVANAMTNNAFNQHRRFIHFVNSGSRNLHKKGGISGYITGWLM